jgi:hypothetical protein
MRVSGLDFYFDPSDVSGKSSFPPRNNLQSTFLSGFAIKTINYLVLED